MIGFTPLNFTLVYDDRLTDVDDTTGDRGTTVGTGPVRFETVFLAGSRIPVGSSTRPAGFGPRVFDGYLDSDGQLKSAPGGSVGLRLWANDPAFALERLQYRVTAELTDLLGRPVPFASFCFDAPTEDVETSLVLLLPEPGQKFGRGPRAFDITDVTVTVDNELVFHRADGVDLGPVSADLSEGTLPQAMGRAVAFAIALG